jgi:putative FmdB family regulatory protein
MALPLRETMPLYEYKCTKCGTTVEAIQKVSEAPLKTCSQCGGALKKLVSSSAIQFKGSGWYVTDYARKGTEAGKTKDNSDAKKPVKTEATKEKKESVPTEKSQASSSSG